MLKTSMIDEVLDEFLKPFGLKARFSKEFGYWIKEDIIDYTVVVADSASTCFMSNFQKLAPDIKCDPFLASLLHEVGHAETLHCIPEDELVACGEVKEKIEKALDAYIGKISTENDLKEYAKYYYEMHQEYFELSDEMEATLWAITYIRENTNKVASFWKKTQQAIMEFYKVNDIKEEE